ncbi:cytochrome C [Rhodobacteraceae bacterium 2376]|uniref:Cytochrome C n=1 Tax=Rhabdonatronobacter sediminivivens TaxID=2743469 RepID=A0A7Z0KYJ2_9RHOB|nr:c-type cytochrome [Rhabdonatronobacter sediminivivens]NYS23453.1 cytochrome C [Rhabdonatronobacter sediminivivens]
MKRLAPGVAALTLFAAPALAGDPAAGESAFGQCQTCHVVQNEDGDILAGRNGRQGPNLYGLVGRTAGTVEGFRYQNSIVQAGEEGLVWDEENLVAYLLNPQDYLREVLDDRRARSGMVHRVRAEAEAADIVAFLAQFGTAAEGEEEDTGS